MNLSESLRRHPGKVGFIVAALAGIAWFLMAHRDDLNRETLVAYGKDLPAVWFMVAFLILPLAGFPLSIFLLLAGIRFGIAGGMVASTVGILFHHVAAYQLAHGLFRDRLRDRLKRAGHAVPPIKAEHRGWLTALFAAIHGPPYAAKLYLWALTDVPFRIYLWVGAPVYIAFCLVPVGAGSAVMNFNPTWIYILVGVTALLLGGGYWLKRRFGSRMTEGNESVE